MKKRKKRGFAITLMGILCVCFAVAAIGSLAVGLAIVKNFETELPAHFFSLTAKGMPPEFYAYQFSDRENRVGEPERLGAEFCNVREAEYVSYVKLPRHVTDAFVAIEDKRFYTHRGVDWYRTMAAAANRVLGFSDSFGASTITQQLIKNLTGDREVSTRRKLQEILYALDLERQMDKQEILELYLNVISFAEQCDGIGAASEYYFSKNAEELTVAEAATLAAIINNPTYYNPIRNPQNNLHRRNLILREMHAQGRIDAEIYERERAKPLGLQVKERVSGRDSWYAEMVIEDVLHDLCAQYGMSRSAATGLLWSGGLRIDTAVDQGLQKTVEEYYRTQIKTPVNSKGERAESALILIDPRTGDVLGVAGAVGEKRGNRVQNYATQTRRPPGSTIKPITVFAQALEKGLITWSSVYDDVPTDFGERPWPHNASNSYRGLTDISYAVAESTNTVAVRVLEEVGLRESFETARTKYRLGGLHEANGMTDCDRAALALGQLHYGVTLRELATAYTPFADRGIYHPYRSYYRVLDREGRVLLSNADAGEVVLSAENAAVMTKLLQGVVEEGTASSITLRSRVECAGKTGTTGQVNDRWFVGYTPELICGVWCGFAYPEPMAGKNICLKVWDDVMTAATRGEGKRQFEVPSSLVRVSYCVDSGLLPSEACACDARGGRVAEGWFVRGTEPREICDRHVIVEYDVKSGGVSHGYCPAQDCRRVSLVRYSRKLPVAIKVLDADYLYGGDPLALPPNADPSQSYFGAAEGNGLPSSSRPFHRSCPAHREPISAEPAEGDAWWRRYFFASERSKKE